MKDPDFFADAACKGFPTEWWFPLHGEAGRQAIAICWSCPVRKACLEWAVETGENHGILGGVRERARLEMRRAIRRKQREEKAS